MIISLSYNEEEGTLSLPTTGEKVCDLSPQGQVILSSVEESPSTSKKELEDAMDVDEPDNRSLLQRIRGGGQDV